MIKTKKLEFDIMCDWIDDPIEGHRAADYSNLLSYLNSVEFKSSIEMDENREDDAISMRYEIADLLDEHEIEFGPATVLEVMVSLARRIDGEIMYDEDLGDRTFKWFWIMVRNIGLEDQDDSHYDEVFVESSIDNLLKRHFRRNGEGALFPCKGASRKEIWVQMNEFLDKYL